MVFRTLLIFLVAAGALGAEDHQRIGVSTPSTHRLTLGTNVSVEPLGYQRSATSLEARLEYEYRKAWSLSVAAPRTWWQDPEASRQTWGPLTVECGWTGTGSDLRSHATGSVSFPIEPGLANPARWYTLEGGANLLRDPVILGVGLSLAAPDRGRALACRGSLAFQEVVNETLTWSLVVGPGLDWDGWAWSPSLGVTWKVGWYEGPFTGTSGVSAGSGLPWGWTTGASWTAIDRTEEVP